MRALLVPIIALLALAHQSAHAFCEANPPPRYVGSPTDLKCSNSDIQSAIDAVTCPNTRIYITTERTYTAQHITVQDKSLSLIGSTAACGTVPKSGSQPVVTLDGTGHTGDSVVTIKGDSNVTLSDLEITNAKEDSDGHGGGLYFLGTGTVELNGVTIDNNYAGYGAGIYFNGSYDGNQESYLKLNDYVLVLSNTAQHSGGGVYVEGHAQLQMITAQASTISFNKALGVNPGTTTENGGDGGGIRVNQPATAIIASPGAVLVPAVAFNTAIYGGGAAISGTTGTFLMTFSTVSSAATAFESNTATKNGGALYIDQNSSDEGAHAAACLFGFRLSNNSAADGAAIYTTSTSDVFGHDEGAAVVINNDAARCDATAMQDNHAVDCTDDPGCNQISGNAVPASGSARSGSVVLVATGGNFIAQKFWMRENAALHGIRFNGYGDDTYFGADRNGKISECLLTDNQLDGNLIYSDDGSNWFMDSCTLANNPVGAGKLIRADSGITLSNSIIYQPGQQSFDYSGNPDDLITNYIVTNDRTGYVHQTSVSVGDPLFVDAGNSTVDDRDYHLQVYETDGIITRSAAVDRAPAAGGTDFDGVNYDQDIPGVGGAGQPRDLGAYEMIPITDRIFADALGDATSLVQ